GTKADLDSAAELMQTTRDPPQRERLFTAVAEAFKGRKVESSSAALRAEMASIDTKAKPEMMTLKLRLGSASEAETETAYQTLSNDDQKLKAQRIELIQAFGEAQDRRAIDPLLKVAESSQWHSVRKAALQSLQEFDSPKIAQSVIESYSTLPKDQGVRAQAVDLLSKRRDWSLALLRAVDQKKIGRTDLSFDVLQRMQLHKDAAINRAIEKNWGSLRQSPKQLQRRMQDVEKVVRTGSGDPMRGKQLFASTCATCHKLNGEGQTIGPDLTGYERDNLEFLLLSIVDPNAAIREEYTN